jgi:hypothetical protein
MPRQRLSNALANGRNSPGKRKNWVGINLPPYSKEPTTGGLIKRLAVAKAAKAQRFQCSHA